nr:MAG TPA: LIN37 [Caudoviricetes sp.]
MSLLWPICRSWWVARYRSYRWKLKVVALNIR